MHSPRFLTNSQVLELRERFGTPLYVYDQKTLEASAAEALAFPNVEGLTVRFAMKALPTAAILRILTEAGLHIDASSGYEVERALRAGVPADRIQLTAQQLPDDLGRLAAQGVRVNACSVHQIEQVGAAIGRGEISIRVNPGLGSGHNNRTNVGGPSSSFGIWHEHLGQAVEAACASELRITRLHSHIGSGGDPEVWKRCASLTLEVAERLPEVDTVNLGGGFKVARMPDEVGANLKEIGEVVTGLFETFEERTGRRLRLEIEPGTFLVANAGAIVSTIIDIVDTGAGGHRFLKVDTGMTELLRPSLYGAQHPLAVVHAQACAAGVAREEREYLVAGHCCESGDILTPAPGQPEGLAPRLFTEPAIGDALVIDGAGAYCSGLSGKNYNSFPEAPEVLLTRDGEFELIRKRQTLEQFLANEL